MKRCTKCGLLRDLKLDFYSWTSRGGITKYQAWCKTCMKLHQAASRTQSLGGRKNRSKYVEDVDGVTLSAQQLVCYTVPRKFKPFTTTSADHCLYPTCSLPYAIPETSLLTGEVVKTFLCPDHWIHVERTHAKLS